MKLTDLISKETKKVEVPLVEEKKDKAAPAAEEKKNEATPAAEEKRTIVSDIDEKTLDLAAEINTDLFCSIVEIPCVLFNVFGGEWKKSKAKKKLKGKDLENRLKQVEDWREKNSKIIFVQGDEEKRINRAMRKLAILNKGKTNESLMIGALILEIVSTRAEIFFE